MITTHRPCLHCEYDLYMQPDVGTCPECGHAYTSDDSAPLRRDWLSKLVLGSFIASAMWLGFGVYLFFSCYAGTHWNPHPIFGFHFSQWLVAGAVNVALPVLVVTFILLLTVERSRR